MLQQKLVSDHRSWHTRVEWPDRSGVTLLFPDDPNTAGIGTWKWLRPDPEILRILGEISPLSGSSVLFAFYWRSWGFLLVQGENFRNCQQLYHVKLLVTFCCQKNSWHFCSFVLENKSTSSRIIPHAFLGYIGIIQSALIRSNSYRAPAIVSVMA